MDRESKEVASEERAAGREEIIERIQAKQPRYLLVAWIFYVQNK